MASPIPRTRPPTGVAHVDAAIAAIETGDAAALAASMRFELQPCADLPEVGGTAVCPAGVTPGTLVEAFTSTQCEGSGRLRSDAEATLSGWLNGVDYLYGSYRWFGRTDSFWGRSGFFVIVSATLPDGSEWGRHIYFSEDPGRATWVAMGCLRPVEEHISWLAGGGTLVPGGTIVVP